MPYAGRRGMQAVQLQNVGDDAINLDNVVVLGRSKSTRLSGQLEPGEFIELKDRVVAPETVLVRTEGRELSRPLRSAQKMELICYD